MLPLLIDLDFFIFVLPLKLQLRKYEKIDKRYTCMPMIYIYIFSFSPVKVLYDVNNKNTIKHEQNSIHISIN